MDWFKNLPLFLLDNGLFPGCSCLLVIPVISLLFLKIKLSESRLQEEFDLQCTLNGAAPLQALNWKGSWHWPYKCIHPGKQGLEAGTRIRTKWLGGSRTNELIRFQCGPLDLPDVPLDLTLIQDWQAFGQVKPLILDIWPGRFSSLIRGLMLCCLDFGMGNGGSLAVLSEWAEGPKLSQTSWMYY